MGRKVIEQTVFPVCKLSFEGFAVIKNSLCANEKVVFEAGFVELHKKRLY